MEKYTAHHVGLVNLSKEYKGHADYYDDYYGNSIYNYKYNDSIFNVCYMNSSIQCLFHLRKFVNFIIKGKGTPLLMLTRNLLIEMINWKEINKKSDLSVKEIKIQMGRIDERYNHNRQEDANEFISNFLDALREETSEKGIKKNDINNNFSDDLEMMAYKKFYNKFYERKGYSFLLDLFYGNYITRNFCKKCGKILSVKFNAFNMIELPIYELAKVNRYSLNIDDILNSFFSVSSIYGAKCEKCNREEVYSKTSIYKLPENLIIFFGRTANEQYIDNKITYNQTLDLNRFLHPNSNSINYYLDCVIEHTGSSEFGHYTAICQVRPKIWFYFSDSFYHENNSLFYSDNAIILLYKSK